MANPQPPIDFDAPAVNPAGFGLYSAAQMVDTGNKSRIYAGVQFRPSVNCAANAGTWPSEPCPDITGLKKEGERPTPGDPFDPVTVWAYDECRADEPEADVLARANQTLRLQEPLLVESAFATRLLADAGAPTAATSFTDAIGKLEEFMGEQGYNGVIHLSRRFAAVASQYTWGSQSGSVLRSPLGHQYAFGGGYGDVLGNTLVVTGPVTVWRDDVSSRAALDARTNLRAAVAERTILVGYECSVLAVAIS